MDKKILSTVIAGMIAGTMAVAANADVSLYGQVDLSLDAVDTDNTDAGAKGDDINMNSNKSRIGIKGSEDLGNGLNAIFQLEYEIDPSGTDTAAQNLSTGGRDQWLGLEGGFGKVRFGTMSTQYKSTGKSVDPMWDTAFDSRNTGLASGLHSGAGSNGEGRTTNAIGFDTANYSGFSAGATYSFDDACPQGTVGPCADDDAYSLGAKYSNGPILAFVDYVTSDKGDADDATKIGGSYNFGDAAVYGAYEFDGGMISSRGGAGNSVEDADLWQIGGSYTMGSAMLYAGYGQGDDNNVVADGDQGYNAWTVAGTYNFSKRTKSYVGFTQQSLDCAGCGENDQFSVGMQHKF